MLEKSSVVDELLKLKKLLDDGVITQEEFDNQKKILLEKNNENKPVENKSVHTYGPGANKGKNLIERFMERPVYYIIVLFGVVFVLFVVINYMKSDDSSARTISNGDKSDKNNSVAEYEITYKNAKTYTDGIGTIWVQVIFEITNTGTTNLYLESGSADLEDKSGKLIDSLSLISAYPQVIGPGEKGYYIEETVLHKADNAIALNIIPRPDVRKAKVEKIRFPVTDIELSANKYGGIDMIGRIENTSSKDESIYIAVILYDTNGFPIGRLLAIEDVQVRKKVGFSGGDSTVPKDVIAKLKESKYIIYAYPKQYQFK